MMQRRFYCATCERQWCFARHWTIERGCIACGSSEVTRIEYEPEFPGGDIPRTRTAPKKTIVAQEQRNWAVEMSGGAE